MYERPRYFPQARTLETIRGTLKKSNFLACPRTYPGSGTTLTHGLLSLDTMDWRLKARERGVRTHRGVHDPLLSHPGRGERLPARRVSPLKPLQR